MTEQGAPKHDRRTYIEYSMDWWAQLQLVRRFSGSVVQCSGWLVVWLYGCLIIRLNRSNVVCKLDWCATIGWGLYCSVIKVSLSQSVHKNIIYKVFKSVTELLFLSIHIWNIYFQFKMKLLIYFCLLYSVVFFFYIERFACLSNW